MREVILNKNGSLKCYDLPAEIYASDLDSSIKSFTPGEWTIFINKKKNERYLGFANPLAAQNSACAHVVGLANEQSPLEFVERLIERAWKKRDLISDYQQNARMIYGVADRLPGLIVDSFDNCVLAQINTAGLDVFRSNIKELLEKLSGKEVHLLDNPSYRAGEGLPTYSEELDLEELKIKENGLNLTLKAENLQKVGFYYDHRENRNKLTSYIKRMKSPPKKGLDLFCYVGAWGMNMSRAGVEQVTFVDQANFSSEISKNWEQNNLKGPYDFHHGDVFDFLKKKQIDGDKYDLIVSDPPAFCKSPKGAKKALQGYLKLHRACLKLLEDQSLFAVCSCTRYVDLDTLAQNAALAAKQEGKRLSMLDIGTQGFDHPSSSLKDNSNYLKYILFYVENL
ncbi:MAG: class I SAM-dependent rRNA methyltransferase [Bacteriovoracaceae bacterium]|nr:class I SAM-dependent rRNA methyltransferase [Bacteriovoracaceae bacterium]